MLYIERKGRENITIIKPGIRVSPLLVYIFGPCVALLRKKSVIKLFLGKCGALAENLFIYVKNEEGKRILD